MYLPSHTPTHPHTVSGFENVTFFVCVFVCFKNYVTCLFDVLWSPVRRFIGGNMHGDTCKWYLDFFILYYTRDKLFMSQSDYTSYRAYSSRIHQLILNNLKLMGTELFKHVKDKPIKIHNASIWWCAYHLKWIVGPTCLKLRKWLL